MSFYAATKAMRSKRKHAINPGHHSRRLTLCETMREIHREASSATPDMAKIADLAAAGFDYGKRQHHRILELKEELRCSR